jgi:hypothetical protein
MIGMGVVNGMHDSSNRHDPSRASNASADLPSKAVFEEVLRATLLNSDQPLDAAVVEIDLLIAVARRYRGESLRSEPIVSELVGTFLKSRFPHLRAPSTFWDEVAREIAKTLMEDPRQNALMHGFWSKLCDKAA